MSHWTPGLVRRFHVENGVLPKIVAGDTFHFRSAHWGHPHNGIIQQDLDAAAVLNMASIGCDPIDSSATEWWQTVLAVVATLAMFLGPVILATIWLR